MWYNDNSLLRSFGQALANADVLTEGEEFAAYLAKPQKYNDTETVWEACGYPTDEADDGWEDFIGSIGEEEE